MKNRGETTTAPIGDGRIQKTGMKNGMKNTALHSLKGASGASLPGILESSCLPLYLFHSFSDNLYPKQHSILANYIFSYCSRYINVTRNFEKYTIRFVEQIRNQILFLHNYNQKVAEVTGCYPLSSNFVQLLLRYISLECKVLYNRQYYSCVCEKKTKERIWRILHNIYHAYFKNKLVPASEVFRETSKAMIQLCLRLKTEYQVHNNLTESFTETLLDRIGELENVKMLLGTNLPCMSDTYFTNTELAQKCRNISNKYSIDHRKLIDEEEIICLSDDEKEVEVPALLNPCFVNDNEMIASIDIETKESALFRINISQMEKENRIMRKRLLDASRALIKNENEEEIEPFNEIQPEHLSRLENIVTSDIDFVNTVDNVEHSIISDKMNSSKGKVSPGKLLHDIHGQTDTNRTTRDNDTSVAKKATEPVRNIMKPSFNILGTIDITEDEDYNNQIVTNSQDQKQVLEIDLTAEDSNCERPSDEDCSMEHCKKHSDDDDDDSIEQCEKPFENNDCSAEQFSKELLKLIGDSEAATDSETAIKINKTKNLILNSLMQLRNDLKLRDTKSAENDESKNCIATTPQGSNTSYGDQILTIDLDDSDEMEDQYGGAICENISTFNSSSYPELSSIALPLNSSDDTHTLDSSEKGNNTIQSSKCSEMDDIISARLEINNINPPISITLSGCQNSEEKLPEIDLSHVDSIEEVAKEKDGENTKFLDKDTPKGVDQLPFLENSQVIHDAVQDIHDKSISLCKETPYACLPNTDEKNYSSLILSTNEAVLHKHARKNNENDLNPTGALDCIELPQQNLISDDVNSPSIFQHTKLHQPLQNSDVEIFSSHIMSITEELVSKINTIEKSAHELPEIEKLPDSETNILKPNSIIIAGKDESKNSFPKVDRPELPGTTEIENTLDILENNSQSRRCSFNVSDSSQNNEAVTKDSEGTKPITGTYNTAEIIIQISNIKTIGSKDNSVKILQSNAAQIEKQSVAVGDSSIEENSKNVLKSDASQLVKPVDSGELSKNLQSVIGDLEETLSLTCSTKMYNLKEDLNTELESHDLETVDVYTGRRTQDSLSDTKNVRDNSDEVVQSDAVEVKMLQNGENSMLSKTSSSKISNVEENSRIVLESEIAKVEKPLYQTCNTKSTNMEANSNVFLESAVAQGEKPIVRDNSSNVKPVAEDLETVDVYIRGLEEALSQTCGNKISSMKESTVKVVSQPCRSKMSNMEENINMVIESNLCEKPIVSEDDSTHVKSASEDLDAVDLILGGTTTCSAPQTCNAVEKLNTYCDTKIHDDKKPKIVLEIDVESHGICLNDSSQVQSDEELQGSNVTSKITNDTEISNISETPPLTNNIKIYNIENNSNKGDEFDLLLKKNLIGERSSQQIEIVSKNSEESASLEASSQNIDPVSGKIEICPEINSDITDQISGTMEDVTCKSNKEYVSVTTAILTDDINITVGSECIIPSLETDSKIESEVAETLRNTNATESLEVVELNQTEELDCLELPQQNLIPDDVNSPSIFQHTKLHQPLQNSDVEIFRSNVMSITEEMVSKINTVEKSAHELPEIEKLADSETNNLKSNSIIIAGNNESKNSFPKEDRPELPGTTEIENTFNILENHSQSGRCSFNVSDSSQKNEAVIKDSEGTSTKPITGTCNIAENIIQIFNIKTISSKENSAKILQSNAAQIEKQSVAVGDTKMYNLKEDLNTELELPDLETVDVYTGRGTQDSLSDSTNMGDNSDEVIQPDALHVEMLQNGENSMLSKTSSFKISNVEENSSIVLESEIAKVEKALSQTCNAKITNIEANSNVILKSAVAQIQKPIVRDNSSNVKPVAEDLEPVDVYIGGFKETLSQTCGDKISSMKESSVKVVSQPCRSNMTNMEVNSNMVVESDLCEKPIISEDDSTHRKTASEDLYAVDSILESTTTCSAPQTCNAVEKLNRPMASPVGKVSSNESPPVQDFQGIPSRKIFMGTPTIDRAQQNNDIIEDHNYFLGPLLSGRQENSEIIPQTCEYDTNLDNLFPLDDKQMRELSEFNENNLPDISDEFCEILKIPKQENASTNEYAEILLPQGSLISNNFPMENYLENLENMNFIDSESSDTSSCKDIDYANSEGLAALSRLIPNDSNTPKVTVIQNEQLPYQFKDIFNVVPSETETIDVSLPMMDVQQEIPMPKTTHIQQKLSVQERLRRGRKQAKSKVVEPEELLVIPTRCYSKTPVHTLAKKSSSAVDSKDNRSKQNMSLNNVSAIKKNAADVRGSKELIDDTTITGRIKLKTDLFLQNTKVLENEIKLDPPTDSVVVGNISSSTTQQFNQADSATNIFAKQETVVKLATKPAPQKSDIPEKESEAVIIKPTIADVVKSRKRQATKDYSGSSDNTYGSISETSSKRSRKSPLQSAEASPKVTKDTTKPLKEQCKPEPASLTTKSHTSKPSSNSENNITDNLLNLKVKPVKRELIEVNSRKYSNNYYIDNILKTNESTNNNNHTQTQNKDYRKEAHQKANSASYPNILNKFFEKLEKAADTKKPETNNFTKSKGKAPMRGPRITKRCSEPSKKYRHSTDQSSSRYSSDYSNQEDTFPKPGSSSSRIGEIPKDPRWTYSNSYSRGRYHRSTPYTYPARSSSSHSHQFPSRTCKRSGSRTDTDFTFEDLYPRYDSK